MLMLAFRNFRDNQDSLGRLKEEVVFDRWQDMNKRPGCLKKLLGYCGLMARPRKVTDMFAKMQVEVQILPKDEAETNLVEEGTFEEPQGRITPMFLATNPANAAKVLLGPTCFRRCSCVGLLLGILIC